MSQFAGCAETECILSPIEFDEVLGSAAGVDKGNELLNAKELLALLTRPSSLTNKQLTAILNSKTVKLNRLIAYLRNTSSACLSEDHGRVACWKRLVSTMRKGRTIQLVALLLYPHTLIDLDFPDFDISYWVWFSRCPPEPTVSSGSGSGSEKADSCRLSRVVTMENWHSLCFRYHYLAHPSGLPPYCNLMYFKDGIKPVPEDPANVNGGQWIIRMKKKCTDDAWDDIRRACLYDDDMRSEEVCGAVLSLGPKRDCISIWHRTAADIEAVNRVRDALREALALDSLAVMQYRVHKKQY